MEILNDFSTSVKKALSEIDPNWESYGGLIVCGTHNPQNVESIIEEIRQAREKNRPFLGICMGMQLAMVEWMRHKGFSQANSAEVDPNASPKVIAQLPGIRVGIRNVYWKGNESQESHWHNFAFARKHADNFGDWELSYTDGVLEIARLKTNIFHYGVQFHPEYNSSKQNPHWLLTQFLAICKKFGNVE